MEVQTAPGNMSDQVTGGILCITGMLAPGTIFSKTGPFPFINRWDDEEMDSVIQPPSPHWSSRRLHDFLQDTFFLVLLKNKPKDIIRKRQKYFHGLVLKRRHQNAKFERLGSFDVWDFEEKIAGAENEKGALTLIQEHGKSQTVEIV